MLRPGKQASNGGGLPAYGSYGAAGQSSYGGYGSSNSFGVGSGGAYDDHQYHQNQYHRSSSGGSTSGGGGGSGSGPRGHHSVPRRGNAKAFADLSPSSLAKRFLSDKFFWACLICVILALTTYSARSTFRGLLASLDGAKDFNDAVSIFGDLKRDNDRLDRDKKAAEKQMRQIKETIRTMERENRQLKEDLAQQRQKQANQILKPKDGTRILSPEEDKRIKAREDAWREQVYLLQNSTARESRRAATERFGKGPHHVKFTLKFPDMGDLNGGDGSGGGDGEASDAEGEGDAADADAENATQAELPFFVAEMAPLDLMPHAVHLFLEQVYHQLWDGTYIYLNGPHVCQGGPQDYNEDEDEDEEDESDGEGESGRKNNNTTVFPALQRFERMQLDRLAFPEYSDKHPHKPWTMGFTGRPGGPDWYINKMDNTEVHGPGGQYQHLLGDEQADPCFATIVDGKQHLQAVFDQPVYPQGQDFAFFLVEPVEIVSARIMESPPETIEKAKRGDDGTKKKKKKEKKPKKPRVNKDHLPQVP